MFWTIAIALPTPQTIIATTPTQTFGATAAPAAADRQQQERAGVEHPDAEPPRRAPARSRPPSDQADAGRSPEQAEAEDPRVVGAPREEDLRDVHEAEPDLRDRPSDQHRHQDA